MKKEIKPDEVRQFVKEKIYSQGETVGSFFQKTNGKLNYGNVTQGTFQMFVTSNKVKGLKCLIPAYEFFKPGKTILIERNSRNVKYFEIDKDLKLKTPRIDNKTNEKVILMNGETYNSELKGYKIIITLNVK